MIVHNSNSIAMALPAMSILSQYSFLATIVTPNTNVFCLGRCVSLSDVSGMILIWPSLKIVQMVPVHCISRSHSSDFIWPFLRPYMGVNPNPKMALISPISCILALIFPILKSIFPNVKEKVAS